MLEDCSIVKFKNGIWEVLPEPVRFEAGGARNPHSPPQEEVWCLENPLNKEWKREPMRLFAGMNESAIWVLSGIIATDLIELCVPSVNLRMLL